MTLSKAGILGKVIPVRKCLRKKAFGTVVDFFTTIQKTHNMKKIYLLFVFAISFAGFSQVQTNYKAKWFLGFNAGTTWQTTDVQNQNDFGWGLTLGRSFNYNYGRIASFDIRARFLTGYWYGQDTDTSGFNYPNAALSKEPTNYKDSFGYAVRNFQTETYRLSAELVLHANRLRERTRWDPYIFGGIGITWHQTYGDYYYQDTLGTKYLYQYDLNDLNKKSIKKTQDGAYDTALDGSNQSSFNATIMPSLGFGIGYQVGKAVTIGLEHKTTFTGMDTYDGFAKSSKYSQDLYHYSSAYIQFRLGGRKEETRNEDNKLPEVRFTQPGKSGLEVADSIFIIEGEIKYVEGRENVTFTQNKTNQTNFNYNANSNRFYAQVVLRRGENEFELRGVNLFGQDVATTIIIYRPQTTESGTSGPKPVVRFIQPNATPITVNSSTFNLVAEVLNVDGKANVEVLVNGQKTDNFTYTVGNRQVTLSLNLLLGSNRIDIKGTNRFGVDSKETVIIYERQASKPKPVVYYTDPTNSGQKVSNVDFLIKAKVLNVVGKQNVLFKQNGNAVYNFNYSDNSGDFTANVRLVAGQNVFELYGTNSEGTESATTYIVYERNAPKPPVVSISQPNSNYSTVNSPAFQLAGSVLNVTDKIQVNLIFNGQSVSNFSFNSSNGSVAAGLRLNEGNNTIRLVGSNSDGTDAKEVVVIYKQATTPKPPVVQIVNPNVNPYTTNQARITFQAYVSEVTTKDQTTLTVNGQTITNYNFNNGALDYSMSLIEGSNVVTVKGTNADGSDSKTTNIVYQKPQTVNPPIVTILAPVRSPYTTETANYNFDVKVDNVASKSDISLRINGQMSTLFTYSTSSNRMVFTTGLIEGSNTIEVIGTNSAGSDTKTALVIYKKPDPKVPPTVEILDPSVSPTTVNGIQYTVQAKVEHVASASSILVKVNGTTINNFDFAGTELRFVANLVEGNNSVNISASNDGGSASDATTIIYKKPVVVNPPTITFVNPGQPNSKVKEKTFGFKAKVFEVNSVAQIALSVNGQLINPNSTSYNVSTREFSYDLDLSLGNNVFEIKATNSAATVNATTNVIYEREVVPCTKPIIAVVNPTKEGQRVLLPDFRLEASILNLDGQSQTSLRLNGRSVNASLSGNTLLFNAQLVKGNNVFEISTSNGCGTVSVLTSVVFEPLNIPCNEPIITLLSPSTTSFSTEEQKLDVRYLVAGVTNSADVSLNVNGQSELFGFDLGTKNVIATVDLRVGVNKIELKAKNACGEVSLSILVTRIACQAPTVTVINANIPDKGETFGSQFVLSLGVVNISSATQIEVTQNNKPITSSFSTSTNVLSLVQELTYGTHLFKVTVTNECGTASYNHTVYRKKAATYEGPTVSITKPSSNVTVSSGIYAFEAISKNVLELSQVSLKLNGNLVVCSFDFASQKIQASLNLQPGVNSIKLSVANALGSASDAKTITFAQPVIQPKPEITMNGFVNGVMKSPVGVTTISGSARNLSTTDGLVVRVNGKVVTKVSKKLVNGVLIFSFQNVVVATEANYRIEISATNAAGTETETVQVLLDIKPTDIKAGDRKIVKPAGGR